MQPKSEEKAVVKVIADAEEKILTMEEMAVTPATAALTAVPMGAAMAQMEMMKAEAKEGHRSI